MGTWYASDSFNWSLLDTSKELLQNELKQTEKEFMKINGYPKWLFDWVNKGSKVPRNASYDNKVTTNDANINMNSWQSCEKIIIRKSCIRTHIYSYTEIRLLEIGSSFNMKDQTKLEHECDLIYFVKCSWEYMFRNTFRWNSWRT